jgi:class 3 adenylate cyclase/DNA-binding CsgD family transcriptional regulator
MAAWDLPDGPVTIMFTDVEGSTALNTRLGDDATRPLLRVTETTIREQLPVHGGHEVKGTGDGHLVWFASARRAVACAIDIQRALVDSDLRVRIGLTTGEVTAEAGDLYGEAVNLAARVAARADGGEIVVADVVRQLTGTLADATYKEKGRFKLKGFPERMRLFTVEWAMPAAPTERSPVALTLVGRDEEVRVARALLDGSATGTGGVLLIEGEPGIGKTRLALEAVAIAERRGAAVVRGVAADLDRTQPFRAIADALGAVRGSLDPRRRRIAELLRSGGDSSSGYLIEEACLELVEHLAMDGPVVLVLEDLQWADSGTLQVLRVLAPSTSDLPLAIVTTMRPTPRSAELQGVIDRLVAAGADLLRLDALGRDDQLALAAEALGQPPDDALAAQLAKTAGNPLYVIELARAASAGDDGAVAASATLRETILGRLGHLPSATVDALRLASVLGSSFTLADLAAAAGSTAVSLVPVLREALAAQLIVETAVGLSFRHDVIREALYEDLPSTARKALHAEIGRALASAGADAGLVAAHLVQGVDAGDGEAVAWIARAAREASRRSITAAIELYKHALALSDPSDSRRTELEAELIVALAWAGAADEGVERAQAALARHPGREFELQIRAALAEVYLASDRSRQANELGRETLALGPTGTDRARFLILANYAVASREAAAEAREARALAEAASDHTLVGAARLVEAFTPSWARDWKALDDHLLAALEAFDRAGTPSAERYRLQALGWRAWLLELTDRGDEGTLVRREARRRAEELGASTMIHTYDTDDASTSISRGRLRDARAVFEGLVAEDGATGNGQKEAWIALIAILTGDPDLPALVDAVRPFPPFWSVIEGLYAYALGEHDRALDLLLHAFGSDRAIGWAWPSDVASPPLIRAALATGRRGEIEAVVVDAETEAAKDDAPSITKAVGCWCRGLADRDADRLGTAIDDLDRADRPLERAFALEDLGGVLAEAAETAAAVDALQRALAAFEELDLPPSVARVSARLRALGVRSGARGLRGRPASGWDSITPSEQAVVDLVAQGMTNPQIAKQLYVSRHTVDSHLKRVYAKLGLSSRVELAAAVARRA